MFMLNTEDRTRKPSGRAEGYTVGFSKKAECLEEDDDDDEADEDIGREFR